MATARHFRLDILGRWDPPNAEDEIWQFGISLVEADAGGVFPNGIKESLPQVNVVTDGSIEDDTDFEAYFAWRGTDKMTKAVCWDLAQAARLYWNSVRQDCSTEHLMTGVRINAVQGDGKVVNGGNYFWLKTESAGTSPASSQLPPQVAMAVSTRTGARGAGGRGRWYLPTTGSGLNNRGLLDTVKRTTHVASAKAYLEALHAAGPLPAVVNAKLLRYSAITSVAIGDVWDTQRKRRNALREDYVVGDLSYN